ncbi:low-specificity L-threonine aldolase [Clostridium luticellarii]|uniref:L-allo-threonine aldolase n=1 Tax=Clostridium luticellarii TaxID=1691940 RepID=A0A2T0BC13_9CLOT|nr:low-specificity L-threonine aldolase [Clostridium luticellarii]MCI1944497.1 low-specificity L-threonine aldolase [Clostridium luticellarii]MCI1967996.1 low-specificity L-threonine aldolase [Clostridium luticellarii]MCI1995065.1 low-specificity L-threonine aldolase [Clostridium luticellarii]MCI2039224.1 low-specificity L-threonine aldolase [Clostridium luticellarii]PRR81373.1 L-allo-threonine aldolase [Clostridium luticellarii]
MRFIELRSDTATQPTQAMREAMYNAEVGDDVYGDDPTMKELEEYAPKLVGKEAALFVPSGTFGNQLSLFTHCKRGTEVILGDDCHIVMHEVGAASVIAGVQLRTLKTSGGEMNPDEVRSTIRAEKDIHYPETGLICMENAYSDGRVLSLKNMSEIYSIARKYNIPVHLDGARVFNAASYLGVDVREITKYCDSVMFCLSKGLCAPVGSMLAGSKSFIEKARKCRKLMGGGLRQAGFLAAAGLVALKKMVGRLGEDHENALLLGEELSKIPGIKVNMKDIQINMVFFDMSETGYDSGKLVKEFYKNRIKINPEENGKMRFVTNYWVKKQDIPYIIETFKKVLNENCN